MLNPESPLPLYQQLAELLLDGIRRGAYPVGSKIPSENELSRQYRVGRPTVRQATEVLVRRRRLERQRGSGTFVTEPPKEVDLFTLMGTQASFETRGLDLQMEIVDPLVRRVVDGGAHNPFSGREAFVLSRVGRIGRAPVLFEVLHLDPEVFVGLERFELSGMSLSELARDQYHLVPDAGRQSFAVVELAGHRARRLGFRHGGHVLMMRRTLDFPQAEAAVYVEVFCRTDRIVFSQALGGGRVGD